MAKALGNTVAMLSMCALISMFRAMNTPVEPRSYEDTIVAQYGGARQKTR